MKVTIKDVARESGFSVATVSLALSDKPSRVSPSTREKIRKIAETLDYTPSRLAVSLATQRSKMIGFLTDDFENPFIAANYMVIHRALQSFGYFLVTSTTKDDASQEKDTIASLLSCGIDGLIYTKSEVMGQLEELDGLCSVFQRSGIPVVSCDNLMMEKYGTGVRCNYQKGGYIAAKHLLELGHRKIACITGSLSLKVTQDRLLGYKQALQDWNVEFDEQLIYEGDYTMDSGENALAYLLGKGVKAVFAFNDEMAFGLYKSAHKYGVRIPEDISIVGFDNIRFADVMETPLTSVGFDSTQVGYEIARRIAQMIEQPETVLPPISYEPSLFVRSSTCRANTSQPAD